MRKLTQREQRAKEFLASDPKLVGSKHTKPRAEVVNIIESFSNPEVIPETKEEPKQKNSVPQTIEDPLPDFVLYTDKITVKMKLDRLINPLPIRRPIINGQ